MSGEYPDIEHWFQFYFCDK